MITAARRRSSSDASARLPTGPRDPGCGIAGAEAKSTPRLHGPGCMVPIAFSRLHGVVPSPSRGAAPQARSLALARRAASSSSRDLVALELREDDYMVTLCICLPVSVPWRAPAAVISPVESFRGADLASGRTAGAWRNVTRAPSRADSGALTGRPVFGAPMQSTRESTTAAERSRSRQMPEPTSIVWGRGPGLCHASDATSITATRPTRHQSVSSVQLTSGVRVPSRNE